MKNKSSKTIGLVFFLAALAIVLTGCSTVHETGRQRVLLLSEKQEHTMGLDAYQQIIAAETISTDTQMTAVVVRVGQRIAAVANRPDFTWEFNLLESTNV